MCMRRPVCPVGGGHGCSEGDRDGHGGEQAQKSRPQTTSRWKLFKIPRAREGPSCKATQKHSAAGHTHGSCPAAHLSPQTCHPRLGWRLDIFPPEPVQFTCGVCVWAPGGASCGGPGPGRGAGAGGRTQGIVRCEKTAGWRNIRVAGAAFPGPG